jgi:hypothetical protein
MLLVMVSSCNRDQQEIDRLSRIKKIGDSDPALAMRMLDSMSVTIRTKPDYLQKKYDLLDIRLHDKAYIPAASDLKIKALVDYYNKNGNHLEKQEALYYAGSVYRDLHDTPRATEYFLRSVDECQHGVPFDSIMLRNAYSNLNDLYYKVQDYHQSLRMALKEEHIARTIGVLDASTLVSEGASLIRVGKKLAAKRKFTEALQLIETHKSTPYHQDLYSLLYYFSIMRMPTQAADTYRLILQQKDGKPVSSEDYFALGELFILRHRTDSAILYFQKSLKDTSDLEGIYDASKRLYGIYHKQGNQKLADYYASVFVRTTEKLDLGGRQQRAATFNNEFQYHRNVMREMEIIKRSNTYLRLIFAVTILSIVIISLLIYVFLRRRKRRVQEIDEKSKMLKDAKEKVALLEQDIENNKKKQQQLNERLDHTQEELGLLATKVEESEQELQRKKQELAEKLNQNRELIKLVHQSEISEQAEDIIQTVKQASAGQYLLSAEEWKHFLHAVDVTFPTFSDLLVKRLGRFSEDEMHVCYLMRIGLSNRQIMNVTGLSRTTLWRWTKKLEWILSLK